MKPTLTAELRGELHKLATDAHELGIIKRYSKGIEANKRFAATATPLTVLALLDELEAKEKHIAELEARTVTVSLPDVMPPEAAPAHYWGSGESMAYADGYNKSTADLKASFAQACSSAGVNVEFE
ncbi:TPA: ead/Ea22-like family protein [Citrobacter koseri]|uniref:ead/Ea22-like family protein n=1 Tax=Citrobacter koseri TaxID=545 RepID=UPI001902525F|nr:ead/Ea22-like family protein [Citrobacter koseri]MBJ9068784.1 ead/Ea22-like family protein [Citrobacter koseri]HEM7954798.1 ead/Ea22-like family protein [Citrobacter koseri]HEM7991993.1 ead/Ea22-like family protein [Citrobacter koseri]